MANVEPNEIQNLLDEVEKIEKTIISIGSTQRKKLTDITINDVRTEIKGAAAKLDPAQWSQLTEDKQNELGDRLETVRNAMLEVTGMGCSPQIKDVISGAGPLRRSQGVMTGRILFVGLIRQGQ